jgi:hypothetical protein
MAAFQRKRRGTVTSNLDWALHVTDEFGRQTIFMRGSVHYPGDLPVGTTGIIEYIPSYTMALDWFTPDKTGRKK